MSLRGGIVTDTTISDPQDTLSFLITTFSDPNPWDDLSPQPLDYPLPPSPTTSNFPLISSPVSRDLSVSPVSFVSGTSRSNSSHGFRGLPIPPESIPLPLSPISPESIPLPLSPVVKMTTRRYVIQPEKPEKFGGEEDEDVDEFLVTMEMYLRSIHIPDGTVAEIERYKVVLLHRHLTGRANLFWYELDPLRRATYALAAEELKRHFPALNHDLTRLDIKNQAISEMNNLSQGARTSKAYADYAQELYTKLGDEYVVALATRFLDGINSQVIQIQLDGQLRGMYTPFSEVIRTYLM